MGYVVAAIFLALGIATLVLYNGTPHGGPTVVCGPIVFWNQTFTIGADCRYISIGELIAAVGFFFVALFGALYSRPGTGSE